MILLTCHLSRIYFPIIAAKQTKSCGVYYDSCTNYFLNMEKRFTFGPLVAMRVIHDEIEEIHLHVFQLLQSYRFFFPLSLALSFQFNTSQTTSREAFSEVLSLGSACFMKSILALRHARSIFIILIFYTCTQCNALHCHVVNLLCIVHHFYS